MTNRQKIDASREVRLWITTIAGALTAAGTIAVARPDIAEKAKHGAIAVKDKAVSVFNKVKSKFTEEDKGAN